MTSSLLRDESSSRYSRNSPRGRESPGKRESPRWNNQNARTSMEELLNEMSPVALETIQTRSYFPSAQEATFLENLFGKPNCVSPWCWKGIDFVFFLIIFSIIVVAIFWCGPGFFGCGAWLLWLFISFLSIILLIGALYSSAYIEQTGATCQI